MVRPDDRAVGEFGGDAVEAVSRSLHGSELRRAADIERAVLERQCLKQCADQVKTNRTCGKRGDEAVNALTFQPDHPVGADQTPSGEPASTAFWIVT